jgi:hypothetical protein
MCPGRSSFCVDLDIHDRPVLSGGRVTGVAEGTC